LLSLDAALTVPDDVLSAAAAPPCAYETGIR
jgi:hypothetical protein